MFPFSSFLLEQVYHILVVKKIYGPHEHNTVHRYYWIIWLHWLHSAFTMSCYVCLLSFVYFKNNRWNINLTRHFIKKNKIKLYVVYVYGVHSMNKQVRMLDLSLSHHLQKLRQRCTLSTSSKQWVKVASWLAGRGRPSTSWAAVTARLSMDTE